MKLRTRVSITAIAAAAALGTAGAFLVPVASASPATHTLKFTSVQQGSVSFSQTAGAQEDKDVSKSGKVIGYDVLRFTFNPKTNAASLGAAVDLGGGILYGQLRGSGGSVTRGAVTGGTGVFKGATGTITAKTTSQKDTAVTIVYHG